jgi:hypothetical protein
MAVQTLDSARLFLRLNSAMRPASDIRQHVTDPKVLAVTIQWSRLP